MQKELSADDHALLAQIEHATLCGAGMGVPRSPARDRLKALGLIYSGKANPTGLRAKSGKLARWRTTATGEALVRAQETNAQVVKS